MICSVIFSYKVSSSMLQVARELEKMLGAPALLVPFGAASDNCHLPNERLQRINLMRGKNVIKHLLQEIATVAN